MNSSKMKDCCPENKCANGLYSNEEIQQNCRLIRNPSDSRILVEKLMNTYDVLAMDAKGYKLDEGGSISLLNVATPEGYCFFFDLLLCPQMASSGKIKDLLECEDIVKVMYDSRYLVSTLYDCYNIIVRNVYDIQIAHAIIEGLRRNISPKDIKDKSLTYINSIYGHQLQPIGEKTLLLLENETPDIWQKRPLSTKAAINAALDVVCLIPGIFENIRQRFPSEYFCVYNEMLENKISSCMISALPENVTERTTRRKIIKEPTEEISPEYIKNISKPKINHFNLGQPITDLHEHSATNYCDTCKCKSQNINITKHLPLFRTCQKCASNQLSSSPKLDYDSSRINRFWENCNQGKTCSLGGGEDKKCKSPFKSSCTLTNASCTSQHMSVAAIRRIRNRNAPRINLEKKKSTKSFCIKQLGTPLQSSEDTFYDV